MLLIRQFRPLDTFAVIKLAYETLIERYNPSLFNFFYETYPKGFLIAEDHHSIVGFIIGAKTSVNTARIIMLGVSDKYRRKNIGSELLNNFLKEISDQNIKNVELEVNVKNDKAILFYQKHGFNIINTVPKFYQNGESAYIMKLNF